jgi:hypothetical protein
MATSTWSDAFGLDAFGFGVDEAPAGGLDATLPVVSDVLPAVGTAIGRSTPVFLTVTDETALRRTILVAKFSTGWEVIYDGDGFSPGYASGSTVTTLVAGSSYRFRIRRTAGWPEAPAIVPFAYDGGGNEPA